VAIEAIGSAGRRRWSTTGSTELAAVLLLACTVAVISALVPLGFQGRDDLHYVTAAEQWLRSGPTIGQDHWANRLPYILAILGVFSITGNWETALYLLHGLCFVATATLIWMIARRSFDNPAVARFGLAVLFTTPLLFRTVSYFYPEALEVALGAVTVVLVLSRRAHNGSSRRLWLVVAGLVGGVVLSIRQTELAIPAALALLILLDSSEPLAMRFRDVASLAAGYAAPVMLELACYWIFTGDPLHRLAVDSRHIDLVSPNRLRGGVPPASTRVLFNWDLASRWNIPSTVQSHWTISPIVRLFTSPGMLLTPWFALIGSVCAWRAGGAALQLTKLLLLAVVVQWVLNTFVLSLPPNTRYFGVSLALMCILAGVALAQIPSRPIAIATWFSLFLLPCTIVAVIEPRPSLTVALVSSAANQPGPPLHLSAGVAKLAVLRISDDAIFARRTSTGPPPPGATVAVLAHEKSTYLTKRCGDGQTAFSQFAKLVPRSSLWTAVQKLGGATRIPGRVRQQLIGESDAVYLLNRRC